jgi:tyrosinase
MDIRKNIYSLSAKELSAFRDALNKLKTDGTYDPFIAQHFAAMLHPALMTGETQLTTLRDSAHSGPAFGPWHRWYLRDFELALQSVAPGVTLPYWDWATDAESGAPASADLWTDDYIGGDGDPANNNIVPDGPFTSWVAVIRNAAGALVQRGFPGLVRRIGQMAQTLPGAAQVSDALAEGVYDNAPWDRLSTPSFRNRLEGWLVRPTDAPGPQLHNRVHVWVGGDMIASTSPNDPVFWLHHANIDRLWAKWQAGNPGQGYVPTSGGPPGHSANDAMVDLSAPGITPSSVIAHKAMGYDYDTL